jgi:geranylgeranyl diphosphate synthase type I
VTEAATTTLRTRIDGALRHFFDQTGPLLESVSADLSPAVAAVRDFVLDGGKRIRPTFCYWGWVGAGGEPEAEPIIWASASLELLQACALIHDDLMDRSDTRRGKPSVHRAFETAHAADGLSGSAQRFGESAAILLGDLALVWANHMFDASGFDGESVLRARPVFSAMCTEVMAGQFLDIVEQTAATSDLERALMVMRYKTAKYTVERPLHLGAALSGAATEVSAVYSGYGLPLGEAFQLRDDVLGVFGDPAATGKPAGDDLREGKRTVLIASTLANADADQCERFEKLFGDHGLDDSGVDELREIITSSGALAEAETLIEQRLHEALVAIDSSILTASARAALSDLAKAIAHRDS